MVKYFAAIVIWMLSLIGHVYAQFQPDQGRPTIRITSPFAGPVWRLDVDTAENFAVGSTAAKALTIWPLADAAAAVTARVPLQQQERKRAHAVAISPNGELVAYSVPPLIDHHGRNRPNSSAIYVIRRATGRIVYVLDGASGDIATRPQSLKYSPDGVHLAAVLSSGCGLRVWTTRDAQLVFKDDVGYGGQPGKDNCCRSEDERCDALPDTTSLHFLRPGTDRPHLVTSGDTGVRVYNWAAGKLTLRRHATPSDIGLERPAGVTASSDGTRLVVGDRRDNRLPPPFRLRIAVLDTATLRPARQPLEIMESSLLSGAYLLGGPGVGDMAQSSFERVAWLETAQGPYIFAAGAFPCEIVRPEHVVLRDTSQSLRGTICLARWSVRDLDASPRFIPVGTERVLDITPLRRRQGLMFLSQERIAAIDVAGMPLAEGGRSTLDIRNPALDMRGSSGRFRISPDARIVEIDDYRVVRGGVGTVTFDLTGPRATSGSSQGTAANDPDQGEDLEPPLIDKWRNVQARSPIIDGKTLPPDEVGRNEVLRAVAILRNQRRVVIGSSEHLRLIDYGGTLPRVLCRHPISEDAYRVNITPDGRTIVSGHADGTLRWWRVNESGQDCRLNLLLTAHVNEKAPGRWTWAAWRPDGTYTRDLDSELKLEWQSTLRDGQVGLVAFQRLLRYIDRDAVRGALDPPLAPAPPDGRTEEPTLDDDTVATEQKRPPLVEIANESYEITEKTFTLALRVAEGRGWPKRLSIKLGDETPLAKTFKDQSIPASDAIVIERIDGADDKIIRIRLELPPKARQRKGADIQFCFYFDSDPEPDSCHPMKWMGEPAPPLKRRLWALFIGVSRAAEGSMLDLKAPENDVIDLARLFVDDYDRRAIRRTSVVPPDFARIQIDLAVSATPDAEPELASLANHTFVRRRGASKADIALALQQVAQDISEATRAEPADDLFLMAYAGHGFVDPRRAGGTAFLTFDATARITTKEDLEKAAARALSSGELLHLLRQIPARKVLIIDACRSLARLPVARPFSPELMRTEFERHSLDAHFFFSSDVGQEAYELHATGFDPKRPTHRQGNGLFTYALLTTLTNPIGGHRPTPAKRIEIPWLAQFLASVFFNTANPDSPANRLRAKEPEISYVPTPRYVPARSDRGDPLLRTLEE